MFFFTKYDLNLNDKDIEQNKNKNLKNILNKVRDSEQKNKLSEYLNDKKIILTKSTPDIYKVMDLEIPTLIFNAYITDNNNKSSIFTIQIMDWSMKLNAEKIKALINLGGLLKHSSTNIFPSTINNENYKNYIHTNLIYSSMTYGYTNASEIEFEIKNIKEQNDLNGSLKADIHVKFTDKSNSDFIYTTILYGFKIKKTNNHSI